MKVNIQMAAVLLALATGCAHHPDKIVFSDDGEIRAAIANTAAPAVVEPHLEPADEMKIEELVFGYLLERRFWDLADYSAVFLQTDDAEVKVLMKKYPSHNPPIKLSSRARLTPHKTPVDKDTRKPAMILGLDVNAPNADGSVDAIGRWYAGDAVTGFRAFHLTKTGDDWQIAEVK